MRKVKYLGCDEDQRKWGNNDDPNKVLTIGNVYHVEYEEVHSWHTKIKLINIEGLFNSVCFDDVKE